MPPAPTSCPHNFAPGAVTIPIPSAILFPFGRTSDGVSRKFSLSFRLNFGSDPVHVPRRGGPARPPPRPENTAGLIGRKNGLTIGPLGFSRGSRRRQKYRRQQSDIRYFRFLSFCRWITSRKEKHHAQRKTQPVRPPLRCFPARRLLAAISTIVKSRQIQSNPIRPNPSESKSI